MPKFLVIKIRVLHSPHVLCASLQCKLGSNSVGIAYYRYQNWLADFYAMANAEISCYKIWVLHSPHVFRRDLNGKQNYRKNIRFHFFAKDLRMYCVR